MMYTGHVIKCVLLKNNVYLSYKMSHNCYADLVGVGNYVKHIKDQICKVDVVR